MKVLTDPPSLDELEALEGGRSRQVPAPVQPLQSPPECTPLPGSISDEPREYKVLTQKDKWFTGKFDPERLEEALNAYAQQGWVVKTAATATINALMGGNREELIIILERQSHATH